MKFYSDKILKSVECKLRKIYLILRHLTCKINCKFAKDQYFVLFKLGKKLDKIYVVKVIKNISFSLRFNIIFL